jgi:hypothetical protein
MTNYRSSDPFNLLRWARFVQSVENFASGFSWMTTLDRVSCRYRQVRTTVSVLLFISKHFSYRMDGQAARIMNGMCEWIAINLRHPGLYLEFLIPK